MPQTSPPRPVSSADICLVNFITENWDDSRWFPAGSLYVASALEQAGYSVQFLDYQLYADPNKYHPEVLARFLERSTAPVLGLGLMIDMLPVTLRALEIYRQQHPDVTVVLEEAGPSNLCEEILGRYPTVDVIVRGEGEETSVELMRALGSGGNLSRVAGLAYRDGQEIRVTEPRARNRELTQLPAPAYHLVAMDEYRVHGVLFSRGCIFKCKFCEIPWIWQHQVQRRPIEHIVAELVHLRDAHGIRRVEVLDDLFVSNRKWAREFCHALIRERVGVEWSCFGYISLMTEELMELMAEAGCREIFYGIESGSDRLLKLVDKKFSMEQARKTVLTTLRYMKPTSSFIWNYPFETLQDFYDTFTEFLFLSHRGSNVCLFMLCPLKPTPYGREHRELLRYDPEVWCHLLKRSRSSHVADMIRADPDLFGAFYHFDTEGFQKKLGLVQKTVRKRV